ncbi:MepB family protein [Flavobacterium ovatum]|uniref:MepB family protein n=1 Tax=Flavobacterium ovatum TaxID=1928857 RepID=UPI00344C6620
MYPELQNLNELVFKPSGLELSILQTELESKEYFAHTFQLGQYKVKFRTAKITPTKTGQFVTLWKRDNQGITAPHSISDDFYFYIIVTRQDRNFGIFLFPKAVLHENRILSDDSRDGKRGFRVYPIWDKTTSKQAQQTQFWQADYFVDLTESKPIDLRQIKSFEIFFE